MSGSNFDIRNSQNDNKNRKKFSKKSNSNVNNNNTNTLASLRRFDYTSDYNLDGNDDDDDLFNMIQGEMNLNFEKKENEESEIANLKDIDEYSSDDSQNNNNNVNSDKQQSQEEETISINKTFKAKKQAAITNFIPGSNEKKFILTQTIKAKSSSTRENSSSNILFNHPHIQKISCGIPNDPIDDLRDLDEQIKESRRKRKYICELIKEKENEDKCNNDNDDVNVITQESSYSPNNIKLKENIEIDNKDSLKTTTTTTTTNNDLNSLKKSFAKESEMEYDQRGFCIFCITGSKDGPASDVSYGPIYKYIHEEFFHTDERQAVLSVIALAIKLGYPKEYLTAEAVLKHIDHMPNPRIELIETKKTNRRIIKYLRDNLCDSYIDTSTGKYLTQGALLAKKVAMDIGKDEKEVKEKLESDEIQSQLTRSQRRRLEQEVINIDYNKLKALMAMQKHNYDLGNNLENKPLYKETTNISGEQYENAISKKILAQKFVYK
jgi:hypothetical protein